MELLAGRSSASDVLKLSLETVLSVLRDKTMPLELRLKAAVPFGMKYFPDKVQIDDLNALTREDKLALANTLSALLARKGELERNVIDVSPAPNDPQPPNEYINTSVDDATPDVDTINKESSDPVGGGA